MAKNTKKQTKKKTSEMSQKERIRLIMGDQRFKHCENASCKKSWMPMIVLPEQLQELDRICPHCQSEKHQAVFGYIRDQSASNLKIRMTELNRILEDFEEDSSEDDFYENDADVFEFNNIGDFETEDLFDESEAA